MIDSLLPYNGERVQVLLAGGHTVQGVLHIARTGTVFVGEWRVNVDQIAAWRLKGEDA